MVHLTRSMERKEVKKRDSSQIMAVYKGKCMIGIPSQTYLEILWSFGHVAHQTEVEVKLKKLMFTGSRGIAERRGAPCSTGPRGVDKLERW